MTADVVSRKPHTPTRQPGPEVPGRSRRSRQAARDARRPRNHLLITAAAALVAAGAAVSPARGQVANDVCRREPLGALPATDVERKLDAHRHWLEALAKGDLPGNLPKQSFTKLDLRAHKFDQYNLSHADFKGADLRGASFVAADLTGADFTGADLSGARMNGAKMKGATLNYSNLRGADLRGAELVDGHLISSCIVEAVLAKANLKGAKMNGADLTSAELTRADLTAVNLSNTILFETNLKEAKLPYVRLWYANYAPTANLPDGHLARIEGLRTVTFPAGAESGLVLLRNLLQKNGESEREREAGYRERQNSPFAGRHRSRPAS
jgi:uncharacterized protein YjbI with pentapeptide repeats